MSWSSGLQFRVLDGKREKGRVIRLDGKELKLGRAQKGQRPGQGEILFREPTVSRVHVTLSWKARKCGFQLAHKSGTNATLVNGKSVKKILLAPGDRIQMGHLIVELESAPVNPHAQSYGDEPPSRSSMTEPILEALSKVEKQHEEDRVRGRAEREEKKRQRELMAAPDQPDPKKAASARRSSRLEEARRNAGARPHRPERTGPVFGWQPPEEREPAPPPPRPQPVYESSPPPPTMEPDRVIQITIDDPPKPRRIELSSSAEERKSEANDQDAVYELYVVRGPDQGKTFVLKDMVMVLGQRQGDNDEREGQGILLSDATLPEEIGMFAWQGREGSYGLLASENSMELIEVERFENGRRRHIKVDSQSSILLKAGDEIRVGLSTLRVQKIGEPLPEKPIIPIYESDEPAPQPPAAQPPPPQPEAPSAPTEGRTTLKALRGRGSGDPMSFRQEPRPSQPRPPSQAPVIQPTEDSRKPDQPAEEPVWSQATLLPGQGEATPAQARAEAKAALPKKRKANPPQVPAVLEWDNRPQVDYLLEFIEGPLRGCQVSINESDLQRNPRLNAGSTGPRPNEVNLEGVNVANESFYLSCEGGRFSLCSESETGIVKINVSPLKNGDRVVLMSGDIISISDTKIRFMERKVVEVLSQYRLLAESGVTGDQDKQYPIGRQRLIVGRGKNCDIRLADLEVSRVHLGIAYSDGKFSVQHRSETNPTFLNGLNLLPGTVRTIKVGDRLRLSSLTVLKFVKL